jgi:hypothetical protein
VRARTIDAVVARLDAVVESAHERRERRGYFAALYRNVTLRVRDGIHAGVFDDGARMERLDVVFANRYLHALDAFLHGRPSPRSWGVAFDAATSWSPLILQHLLLGINAHINFDLGIAAAETVSADQLPSLQHDFDTINTVLASMLAKVKADIEEVSPWVGLLDHVDPSGENAIIGFALDNARANAWLQAALLVRVPRREWPPQLEVFDRNAALLGHLILHPPGLVLNASLSVIRARETNDVRRVIDVLSQD